MAQNINLADFSSSQGFIAYGSDSTAQAEGNFAGNSVSTIGDINGDGKDDVIIGAAGTDGFNGISYLIYGSSHLPTIIDLAVLTSTQGFSIKGFDGEGSGFCVSGAGDVNNDGYDDIIIGAPFKGPHENGISYIIFGNTTSYLSNIELSNLLPNQGISIYGNNNSFSGWSAKNGGDINGDKYDDVIIGAFGDDRFAGVSYIIYGNSTMTDINLASLNSYGLQIYGSFGDFTGWSVSGAGDINNDTYDDIIIGAPFMNSKAGVSYLIYGAPHLPKQINLAKLTSSQGFFITGFAENSYSGFSVSDAGDVNNDGYDDIIIGAPGNIRGRSTLFVESVTYVIFGNKTEYLYNISLADLSLSQGFLVTGSYLLGFSVRGAGDFNSDGYSDIVIGSPGADTTYLIYGGTSLSNIDLSNSFSNKNGLLVKGYGILSALSVSVSGAGDVNGDGYDDIIIGDPGQNSLVGAAYMLLGGLNYGNFYLPSNGDSYIISIYGAGLAHFTGDRSGTSVNGGDINGDGYDDVIIGAPGAYDSMGRSYIIYGKQDLSLTSISLDYLNSSEGFLITGPSIFSACGQAVSSAGDINNDGYDDIIIGCRTESDSINICNFLPITIPSSIPICNITFSNNSNNFLNPGISYTIYGNHTSYLTNLDLNNLLLNQGFSITGEIYGSSGFSVSNAGDVNNDGYDDVIIGAPYAYQGAGISYIIFGNELVYLSNINLANLQTNQGFSVTGTYTNLFKGSHSGYSVSRAGDINNDGYDDIIIGSPSTDNSQYSPYNAGISYIIYGNHTSYLSDINLINLLPNQGVILYGVNAGDLCGYSVSSAGDIDNDGYDDVIIGAPQADFGTGVVYVIYGAANLPFEIYLSNLNTYGFSITGAANGDSNGWSVRGAGDINNDGYDDVIIGAPGANNHAGVSYVILGQAAPISNINVISLTEEQGFSILGDGSGTYSGWSVSGVGDIDGNGCSDLIVGAPRANKNAGISYIIYGEEAIETNSNTDFWYTTDGYITLSAITFVTTSATAVFSRGACFNVLQHWNANNFVYKMCNFVYGHAYAAKKQADDQRTTSNVVEMSTMRSKNDIEINNDNPLHENTLDTLADSSQLENVQSSSRDTIGIARTNTDVVGKTDTSAKGCVVMCIGDENSLKAFENIANVIIDGTALKIGQEIVADLSDRMPFKQLITASSPSDNNAIVTLSTEQFSSNADFSSSYLIGYLLIIRSAIEYTPIIKAVYPLVENYLPEAAKNISLPEVLSSKTALVTVHLATGTLFSMTLPAEAMGKALVMSTAASASLGIGQATSYYFNEYRKEVATHEKQVDIIYAAKHCAITIAAYTVPAIATCALANVALPGYQCSGLDLNLNLSFTEVECYSVYQKALDSTQSSTAKDIMIPTVATAIMTSASNYHPMMIVASTITADYLSNVVIDLVPDEIKENYIIPVMNAISEVVSNIAGNVYGYFYAAEA